MDQWIYGTMDGWMDIRMDQWMDGWVNRYYRWING